MIEKRGPLSQRERTPAECAREWRSSSRKEADRVAETGKQGKTHTKTETDVLGERASARQKRARARVRGDSVPRRAGGRDSVRP